MKRGYRGRWIVGLGALCLVVAGAAAAAKGGNPLVGAWELDAAKSSINGKPGFASGHVVVTSGKDGTRAVVDYAPPSGAAIHYEYTYKEGAEGTVSGNTYFDSATMVQVDRNTSIRTERRGGKVVGITTIEVAKDGKSFTASSRGTATDGRPFTRVSVFTRAKK